MPITLSEQQSYRRRRHRRLSRPGRPLELESAIDLAESGVRRRPRRRSKPGVGSRVEPARQTAPAARVIIIRWPKELAVQWVARRWLWVLLLAVLAAVLAWVSMDERFFVYRAQIIGARHVDAAAIYAAAGVHEQNILWIQPKKVADGVLRLQGIKSVQVRLSLPSVVVIQVEEREPVLLWRATAQKRDWWVDSEGVVLPYHGDPNAASTVFVVDMSSRQVGIGDRIEPKGTVQSVRRLAAALPEIRVFFYQAERGLSFIEQTGQADWPVYVGTSEDLEQKIQVVAVLGGYFVSRGIRPSFVDVRWPDRPVFGTSTGQSDQGG